MRQALALCVTVLLGLQAASARVLDIKAFGADATDKEGVTNRNALSYALGNSTAGDVVTIAAGEEYHILGGIQVYNKTFALDIQGVIVLVDDIDAWPVGSHAYLPFIGFFDVTVNLTGSGTGYIDGKGVKWWNKWILDPPSVNKPYLFEFTRCTNCILNGFTAHNSPGAYIVMNDVEYVEIFDIDIETDRKAMQAIRDKARLLGKTHNLGVQPEDLNTGGINPSGRYIHVHDVRINNDDDSIAVKPLGNDGVTGNCTEHLLFERMTLVGYGAAIGSVPPSTTRHCVRNVTFRHINMPETGKGIYVKSNPSCGPGKTSIIQDILYENVTIESPSWWAVWIGPQQQHEPGKELGEKCALDYPIDRHCPTQGCTDFRNVVLKDVTIYSPRYSPGVILGNSSNPMEVTFDNVNVRGDGGVLPFGHEYKCENTKMTVINSDPAPKCE